MPQTSATDEERAGPGQSATQRVFKPILSSRDTHRLRWSPQAALWLEGDQQRSFDSLSRLTEKATGAALPIHQLFDWLEGRAVTLPGWQADLSGLQQGFLVVRRTDPAPEVVLRIKIDANP